MCFLCDFKHSAWQSRRGFLLATGAAATAACTSPAPSQAQVDVGAASSLRNLVPAGELETAAGQEYAKQLADAKAKGALAQPDNPQLQRLHRIAARLVPQATQWNPRAKQWHWEINLIGSKQLNAFCMPGGKIAVYSGLLETLKLTDDEVAIVMAHEVAHALREHARERMAKSELTNLGVSLLGQKIGDGRFNGVFQAGGSLLTLKFSRSDETDADIVGLELAARAGYDPRAGITLWQKMGAGKAPPQWLSTHPSGKNREQEIARHLPEVLQLYEKARR